MNNLPILLGLNDHQLWVMLLLNLVGMLYGLAKIHSADRNAKQAKDQTVGTSNGFAKHVLEKLDELRIASEIHQHSLDFLQSTQDDQGRQLRDTQSHLQHVEERQTEHLSFHVKAGK